MSEQDREPMRRVTFRLDELHAIKNPERIGSAEWSLRVLVNDIERWSSPQQHKIDEGERVAIDASFHVEIRPSTHEMNMSIEATEHDIGPDDKASGSKRLYESMDFGGETFYVEIEGDGAELKLMCSAEVEEI